MSVTTALSAIGESVAVWLNPERKEKMILRGAIEAGQELMDIRDEMIRRNSDKFSEGRSIKYRALSDKQLLSYEVHFLKRWNAWKDGRS